MLDRKDFVSWLKYSDQEYEAKIKHDRLWKKIKDDNKPFLSACKRRIRKTLHACDCDVTADVRQGGTVIFPVVNITYTAGQNTVINLSFSPKEVSECDAYCQRMKNAIKCLENYPRENVWDKFDGAKFDDNNNMIDPSREWRTILKK